LFWFLSLMLFHWVDAFQSCFSVLFNHCKFGIKTTLQLQICLPRSLQYSLK
jgi:hypothetical protein